MWTRDWNSGAGIESGVVEDPPDNFVTGLTEGRKELREVKVDKLDVLLRSKTSDRVLQDR